MGTPDRTPYLQYSAAQRRPGDFVKATAQFFADNANINAVHPSNETGNGAGYHDTAFDWLYRRDAIVMAGSFEDSEWISVTGYYVGHFARNWLGIRATGRLAYLRFGEFQRMQNGQAVEIYIFLDIPELMTACGQWPIATGPGFERAYTGLVHGPATQDGVMTGTQDPAAAEKIYQIVSDMLLKLATEDEAWRPYWDENMVWYGPGAFGSFIGIEHFASFQAPFEGWSGGSKGNGMTRHFTRYGKGDYTCSGGWPSLTGVSVKPFLEQAPNGERVYMRVCDWSRREDDLLVENWVFVDVPHVLLQLGFNLFAEVEKRA